MAARIFTDEFLAHANGLKDKFTSLKDLAAHLEVDAGELSKNLRTKGYPVPNGRIGATHRRINIDLDQIVALHCAGNPVASVAKTFGVSPTVIFRIMRGGGITPRKDFYDFTDAEIVRMFNEGYSVLSIAEHFKVSRNVVAHRLKRNGITPRGASAANHLRFERTSGTELRGLTEAARRKRIANLRDNGTDYDAPAIGLGEVEFRDALVAASIEFTEQSELGPYALDFRVRNVAVEVKYSANLTAGYTAWGQPAERAEYIRKAKLGLITILHSGVEFLKPALPYVVALVDRLSRDPSFRSQERMIRCRSYSGLSRFKGNKVAPVVVTPDFMATIHEID